MHMNLFALILAAKSETELISTVEMIKPTGEEVDDRYLVRTAEVLMEHEQTTSKVIVRLLRKQWEGPEILFALLSKWQKRLDGDILDIIYKSLNCRWYNLNGREIKGVVKHVLYGIDASFDYDAPERTYYKEAFKDIMWRMAG